MTSAFIEQCSAVIAQAPGPAPWYLGQPVSDLSTQLRKLVWERDAKAGPAALIDGDRCIYAMASMMSYVRRISPTRFVVWYKSGKPEGGEVHFLLYEISALQSMTDEQTASARLKRTPFATAGLPLAECTIPRSLPVGSHGQVFHLNLPSVRSCLSSYRMTIPGITLA